MSLMDKQLAPAELVGALDALDVLFLAGGVGNPQVTPVELLQGLACAPEARLRSAIVPLILRHPEFADDARIAAQALSALPLVTCECFYTAALLLQREYRDRLARVLGAQPRLPDWFSAALGIVLSADVSVSLRTLGARHAALTGLTINWVGTYRHAAERLIRHREVLQQWNYPRVQLAT
ncbi:MAG: hypothetical protein FJ009_05085 [Chloroflexi bacterium]|nr:hypothetical protein [Chloroflexota bacterium]